MTRLQPPPEIKITDKIPGAEYANEIQVDNPNKDEFHLMFLTIAGTTGKVVCKVITNPSHFKHMAVLMSEVINKYEDKYGKIEEAPEVEKEIGFKG
ncbi:MAG: hypothetical protein UT48_C0002G0017 [Parcubacteria group bacterium GW2011_GWE2_39_37]|uniref:DUF3467 domain-containing protein n=1 Tax=Candidatus Falkowbacteria bacterium GW2011_GWF2_39_8 TaxID=1618642 RepID=A0A0G0SBA8_9BACT|nr:MAG: hypothetical protein UT48_C0002G0017 [Parcubacteria group bacterium GW2011_GWE2_39_37]KKR32025.1 MAG: hypothetical protein UT64_C0044G0002 [Candidatus Falkowbacteria bacterium GW2011_GWF2_39_8]